MTEAVAILSLSVAIVALRVAVRARRDLVEYGTALDAGVIAGMRRDHFNLAHAFTETRKLVDVQDVELNAAADAIEELRKPDDQFRALAARIDHVELAVRALEHGQKKPPAKKRAK